MSITVEPTMGWSCNLCDAPATVDVRCLRLSLCAPCRAELAAALTKAPVSASPEPSEPLFLVRHKAGQYLDDDFGYGGSERAAKLSLKEWPLIPDVVSGLHSGELVLEPYVPEPETFPFVTSDGVKGEFRWKDGTVEVSWDRGQWKPATWCLSESTYRAYLACLESGRGK